MRRRPDWVLFIRLVIGLVAVTAPAFALVERRVEQRFEVPPNAVLNVDTCGGAVRITEEPNGKTIEVVVIQVADVDTDAAMDARLAHLNLNMSQRNGTVALTAAYRTPVTWSWKSWPPVNLAYEIKVPRRCDVQVATREGSIVVGSLEGSVVLSNQSGNIFTGEIQGPITARSKSGQIAITAASGAIDVSTMVGNIMVGRAGARARLSSDGGYIELQQAGGELVIRGNGSDAKVGFAQPIKHAADIEISGGRLTLILETNSVCTLDARSSIFGKVDLRGELPLKVTSGGVGRSSLEAAVNGGGPRIVARASGGNVVVHGVEPLLVARPDNPAGVTMR